MYGAANKLVGNATQQLKIATWRFRPSTCAVNIVEDSLKMPNGIAISPDGRTMYISDTSASVPGQPYNALKKRTLYAYDVWQDGNSLLNKREIFEIQTGVPDGIKVARNGHNFIATGIGVDVLAQDGSLLLLIQTPISVQNLVSTGRDLTYLWMVGIGGTIRVKWALQGMPIG
jgi:sugar lactone lactonase YvrE